ncbi:uncharacterized protein TNCV_3121851 [Trichonephila clavipes]|nr:uncharacterized protein TNCV_3121851 [Trichonephila clavipes]
MLLRRFRRQYEQWSQFERGRIIGMMEGGWSARQVARQLGRFDCVLRSDEPRFSLSSDDKRVRVWRPYGERLNPAFALKRHATPAASMRVWGAIAYNTRSPPVLICSATHDSPVTILRLRIPLRRNRRQYEQLTDFDRGRIIGLREAGWSNRRIGRHLGQSDMVVARFGNSGSQKTSSAIKRNHKETTDRSWLEEPTSAKTLTTDPTSLLETCHLLMNPDSVSMTTARVWNRPAVRSGIYCRAAYSNFTSKYYKEEEAKELLEVITAERLETEQQQKLEQQEQLSIEKLRLEIELSRNANQSATQNNGQTSRVKSLDEIVKMVRLLTVKVPNKSDGWDYFFSSLEK